MSGRGERRRDSGVLPSTMQGMSSCGCMGVGASMDKGDCTSVGDCMIIGDCMGIGCCMGIGGCMSIGGRIGMRGGAYPSGLKYGVGKPGDG